MNYNDYFKAVPVLESDRLLLRPFGFEDMSAYVQIIADPGVQQFLGDGICNLSSERHVANWLNNINGRLLQSKTVFTWCAEYKDDHCVIGRIDLGGFVKKSMADLAYHFSSDYWGRGLATEAVKKVVEFGINNLKLHRIQATVMPENAASLRVLGKAGFVREGLLRKYSFGKEFHDAVMLSMVDERNLKGYSDPVRT